MSTGPGTQTAGPPAPETRIDVGAVLKRVGMFAGIVVLVVLALSALPGIGEVRERFAATDWRWLVAAGVISIVHMVGWVIALWGAFDRIPPLAIATELGFAEQGTNVLLPAGGTGGPAFGALVMRRAGVPASVATERHAVLFLVTSGVSLGALVVFGLLCAVGVLPGRHGLAGTLIPAAIGAIGIGVAILFGRMGAPASRPPESGVRRQVWRARRFLHAGVRESLDAIRHGDPLLSVGSVVYYAFDVAALACTFQAFGGGGPTFGLFVLAYTIGHAGAFIPTPGGVGGTDGGLIGAFALYGTALAPATAAVLGYRVFQLGLPVIVGAVSLVRLRRHLQHAPPPEVVAARYAEACEQRQRVLR